jgi:hypothetical protein
MGKFWRKVKSAFKKVAAVALVVIAIVNPALIPAIGNSILTTLGVAAPSAAAATAAGSAAITTASSLAQGNSLTDSLKAGAVSGVTSFVGISTATATGSSAIGSAAGSAAGTVVAGGRPEDIIRNAVSGGIGAGVGDAVGSTEFGKTTGVGTAAGKGVGTFIATGGNVEEAINVAVNTQLIDLANVGYQNYKDNAYKATLSPEQQAAADAQKLVDTSKAQPGTQLADAGTGTMTDAGNQLGEVRVTAGREAGAVENVLPYTSTTVTKPTSKPAGTLPEVKVTAKREPGAPENVLPYTSTNVSKPSVSVPGQSKPGGEIVVTAQRETDSLPEVKVTAQREPGAPENVLPFTVTDSLPEVQVTGQREIVEENQPIPEKSAKEAPAKTVYPSMYFTGVAPTSGSPLAQGLNLSSGAPLPTTGLTSSRGAGEIESKESGKKRSTVWNEESLRLKDALGL